MPIPLLYIKQMHTTMDKTERSLYYDNNSLSLFVKFNTIENVKSISKQIDVPINDEAFMRDRLLTVDRLMGYMIMPRTDSSFVSLAKYFHDIKVQECPSKAAFTKRRALLPYSLFREELREQVKTIYTHRDDLKLWHGHLLFAIDGTVYSLPNTEKNREVFLKGRKVGNQQKALARGVVMGDCLNDFVWDAKLESYDNNEIKMGVDCLRGIPEVIHKMHPVCLMDRLYCAYPIINTLIENKIDFVIRVKKGFNEKVDAFLVSSKKEEIVRIAPRRDAIYRMKTQFGIDGRNEISVRLVRMDGGVVVMTSLTDMSLDDLMEVTGSDHPEDVYKWRWRIEILIGFLKNSEMIEIFSGIKPDNIRQDFFCRTILYNLLTETIISAAKMRRQSEVLKRNDTSKYRLVVDKNVALGLLCDRLPQILNAKGEYVKEYITVLKLMGRTMIPVMPGRSVPRLFRKVKHSGKYITLTNYKKAI